MSLLIFTPTWISPITGEDAVHPACEASIKIQVGVEFDWYVTADNPWPVYDERGEHVYHYENVLHQYCEARKYFLNGNWDTLLTVEHDNVLPDPEAVQRLMSTPGDVVYAPYLLRHGQKILSTFQWINDRNLGMSLSNYRAELKHARENVVHRVSGAGFGCTLIRRHVLMEIEFTGASDRDQNKCPDLRFAEDCLRRRFISNGRFDVPVMHYDGDYCFHPFQSRRNGVDKYIAQETVRAFAAGRIVQLTQGDEIELTEEEALELSRCGYIDPAQIHLRAVRPPVTPPIVQATEPPVLKAEDSHLVSTPLAKRPRRPTERK